MAASEKPTMNTHGGFEKTFFVSCMAQLKLQSSRISWQTKPISLNLKESLTASREIKHDNRIYVHGIVREMSHNQLSTRTSENGPRPSEFYVPRVNFKLDRYIII